MSEAAIQELRDKVGRHEAQIAENKTGLSTARELIDVKLTQITDDIKEVKSALKWAGGLIISLMISFMAWAALQQYNANETQKADLQKQVNLLKTQDEASKERDAILRQLQKNGATFENATSKSP